MDDFSTTEIIAIVAVTMTFWFFVIRRWFILQDKKLAAGNPPKS